MVQWYTTPISVYAGDPMAFAFRVNVQPDPDVEVYEAEDLSAYTDWASEWRPIVSSDTEIELEVDATDADAGLIVVRATGIQVRTMAGNGVFDVQAIGTDGEPRTFIRAKTSWKLDVTR